MRHAGCDLVVVSHACVLADNQRTYLELLRLGCDVHLVVPSSWRSEYDPAGFRAQMVEGLEGRVHPVHVLGRGRPQRHAYLARTTAALKALGPRVVLIEEEPFSVAAAQWARATRSIGLPFGVQVAETLDRGLPAPAAWSRGRTLRDASFVIARSPAAASLAAAWGALGDVVVVAHGIDELAARPAPTGRFTVAFVGRLVPEKGVGDLLVAARLLGDSVRVVVAGDGPMAAEVHAAGANVEPLGAVPHGEIGRVYDQAHVTCVPSRVTSSWEEQFGRVLVESLVREVPVVATSTGQIPWVLGTTGGGVLVEAANPIALAEVIGRLASDREGALALGRAGRRGVLDNFTNAAAAATVRDLLARLS